MEHYNRYMHSIKITANNKKKRNPTAAYAFVRRAKVYEQQQ